MNQTDGPDTVPAAQETYFPRTLPAGALLDGRYRLEAVLGRGGMAVVHRACDEQDGRSVAIKLFHSDPDAAHDAERQGAEVAILRDLDHPHIVRALGAGTDAAAGRSYLVLELVQGRTLAQRIADGPMPRRDIARIGSQIAAALAHIHGRDIVHRDIKPANILLAGGEAGPQAKLTDFGVARVLDGSSLTMYGMTVGTANYLSPEQALGHEITARSDIYCLGLTLLEALTGRKAFPGHGVDAALARLLHDPAIPASLGPAWPDLLRDMTAREPHARPSAAEVADRLGAFPEDGLAPKPLELLPEVEFDALDDTLDDDTLGPLAGFHWHAEEARIGQRRTRLRRLRAGRHRRIAQAA